MGLVSSANICLGAHAGNFCLTTSTFARCRELQVRAGLHPGFPDREGMGRLPWPTERIEEAETSLRDQIEQAPPGDCLKPHGALYLQSSTDEAWARLLARLLRQRPMALMGLAGTLHEWAASEAGVPLIREGFVDRRIDEKGYLLPRSAEGAFVSPNDQLEHVLGQIESVDSLCVHGDVEGCVERLAALRASLEERGISIGWA